MNKRKRNKLIRYRNITDAFNRMYHEKGMRLDLIYEELRKTMGWSRQTIDRAIRYDTSELDNEN